MDGLRRNQIIAPGPSVIERMVAAAMLLAKRRVASQLTKGLNAAQTEALDALLKIKKNTSILQHCHPSTFSKNTHAIADDDGSAGVAAAQPIRRR
jgi:hypothetical protein